jgi:hypothetical protein
MLTEIEARRAIGESVERAVKSFNYFTEVTQFMLPSTTKKAPFALITIKEGEPISNETPCCTRKEYSITINCLLYNSKKDSPMNIKSDIMYKLKKALRDDPVIGWFGQERIAFLQEFTDIDFNEDEDISDNLMEISLTEKLFVTVSLERP